MYTSPRQVLPPALTMGSVRVKLSPQYTRQRQESNTLTGTSSRTPKTPSLPQSATLLLSTLDYTKREDQVYYNEKKMTDTI